METFRICDTIKDALGAKRFAAAVGRTLQTVYSWCRDQHDPNADGERNLFDWFEAVVDALAARPEGRPVLIQLRSWMLTVIDRALSAWKPQQLTPDALVHETSRVLREFSDFIDECGSEDFCRDRLAKEGAEAMEAIERLIRSAHGGMESEKQVRKIG